MADLASRLGNTMPLGKRNWSFTVSEVFCWVGACVVIESPDFIGHYHFSIHVTINLKVSLKVSDMTDSIQPDEPCPIARSLAVAGDGWNLLILREAHAGMNRFDQFRKNLGIAPTMLTKRLAALTDEGLFEKRRYSENPPRDEYVLTAAGLDFLPVLFIIGAWGKKHRRYSKSVRFLDAENGTEIQAVAIDAKTGAPIGTRPIKILSPALKV